MATFNQLQSDEAILGRKRRKTKYIVWAEMPSGNWAELDADSLTHACKLAQVWMDNMGAVCSTRKVLADGSTRCLDVLSKEWE